MIRTDTHYIGRPVRSLQTMLRTLSYVYPFLPRVTPDGVFGERTLEAVMLLQREFFPPVTGRVDQGTWDAITALYRQAERRLSAPLPALCDYRGNAQPLTIKPTNPSENFRVEVAYTPRTEQAW